jgi:hypothetical protein
MTPQSLASVSFRDPAGFVYQNPDGFRRQVNHVHREHYDRLVTGGLYDELVAKGLLVEHIEIDEQPAEPSLAYKVIQPELIEFISFPYEWAFSELKDAALLTLESQRTALRRGMTLKDASAYNVQFRRGRPILIDTLSLETYHEGEPWVAYRQFCQHFLAPLSLMSLVDHRLSQLFWANIDGVPLDLAARTLPWKTKFRLGLAVHIHLHAAMGRKLGTASNAPRSGKIGSKSLLGLVDSLESAIAGLTWQPRGGGWSDYYEDNLYSESEFQHKERLVGGFLGRTPSRTAWDLGANTGHFSRIAARKGTATVAFDADPGCVEANYLDVKKRGETKLLPLVLDLTNPSPALGWMNAERASLFERGEPDLVLALALLHHLAISGNQPMENLARLFNRLSSWLVIEFVPENDPQFRSLADRRRGVHHPYNRELFEQCFHRYFTSLAAEPLSEGGRRLYLMRRREAPR